MQLQVDVGKKSISIAVNNGAFKQAAMIAPSKTPYFLAVALFNANDCVSLVSYTAPMIDKGQEETKEPEVRLIFRVILCKTINALVTTTNSEIEAAPGC